jgi:hypothetical protein
MQYRVAADPKKKIWPMESNECRAQREPLLISFPCIYDADFPMDAYFWYPFCSLRREV